MGNPYQSSFSLDDVVVLNDKKAYDGFFKVSQYQVKHRLFEGGWSQPITRELLARGDAAVLFLYDVKLDALVLLEQFRIGAMRTEGNPWLLETVAGMIKPGEEPKDVACREAKEEANVDVAAETLVPMVEYLSSPGGTCEKLYLFIAPVDASNVGGNFGLLEEEGEDIRAVVVPRQEALALLEAGKIVNAATIIGLQWLQLHRDTLLAKWQTK